MPANTRKSILLTIILTEGVAPVVFRHSIGSVTVAAGAFCSRFTVLPCYFTRLLPLVGGRGFSLTNCIPGSGRTMLPSLERARALPAPWVVSLAPLTDRGALPWLGVWSAPHPKLPKGARAELHPELHDIAQWGAPGGIPGGARGGAQAGPQGGAPARNGAHAALTPGCTAMGRSWKLPAAAGTSECGVAQGGIATT
jgi:hypothetical protein